MLLRPLRSACRGAGLIPCEGASETGYSDESLKYCSRPCEWSGGSRFAGSQRSDCAETVLLQAAEAGADLVLTGEFKHQLYHLARELGMNVIAAGHYATETVGVKAVMEKVASEFGIETEFADCPTGL